MKTRTFFILGVACVILGVSTWLVLEKSKTSSQGVAMGEKLLEELPVNQVSSIEIIDKDAKVHLKRGAKVWEVADRYGYPADFGKITEFVKKLKDLKIGRKFKSSTATLDRLALYRPDEKDKKTEQKGTQIILKDEKGKVLSDLILGSDRKSDAGYGGHYVKIAAGDTIYLVDQNFSYINKKPAEWIQPELLDIAPENIQSVTCLDADGKPVYRLQRPEKGKDAQFMEPPQGKEAQSPKIESVMRALTGLRLADVADPAIGLAHEKFARLAYLEYRLFDGTLYKIYPGAKAEGDEHYLRIAVSYVAPDKVPAPAVEAKDAADKPEIAPAVPEAAKPQEAKKDAAKSEKSPADLAAQAVESDKKLGAWTYVIGKWQFDNLITQADPFFEGKKE